MPLPMRQPLLKSESKKPEAKRSRNNKDMEGRLVLFTFQCESGCSVYKCTLKLTVMAIGQDSVVHLVRYFFCWKGISNGISTCLFGNYGKWHGHHNRANMHNFHVCANWLITVPFWGNCTYQDWYAAFRSINYVLKHLNLSMNWSCTLNTDLETVQRSVCYCHILSLGGMVHR